MTQEIRDTLRPARLFIDGQWSDAASGATFATVNPATEEPITTVAEAGAADVERAVAAAERAFAAGPWAKMPAAERGRILWKIGDLIDSNLAEMARLETLDQGKTITDSSRVDVPMAAECFRYFAGWAGKIEGEVVPVRAPSLNYTLREPIGVVGAITPWNFPILMAAWKVAPALAAGNTVVLKPARETPLTALRLAELAAEAGLPPGVLNVVPGKGTVAGAALVDHPRVGKIAFTGSTEVARIINRTLAERPGPIVPFIAETGGQNAMIVDSSALPEQVTRDVVSSAFQSAGQRCSALRVLFVQDDVADGMVEMIGGAMQALSVGDPRDVSTDCGPVIDADAKRALDEHLAWLDSNARRVRVLDLPPEAERGTFVAPAMYEIASLSDLNHENFGPILHVVRFPAEGLGSVIDQINATGYGLTLGLQSRIDTTRDFVEQRARVGNFYVNRNQIGAVVESQPFGGEGLSGTGPKAGGPHYVARFATERVTCIDTTAAGGNASLMAAIDG